MGHTLNLLGLVRKRLQGLITPVKAHVEFHLGFHLNRPWILNRVPSHSF